MTSKDFLTERDNHDEQQEKANPLESQAYGLLAQLAATILAGEDLNSKDNQVKAKFAITTLGREKVFEIIPELKKKNDFDK